MASKEVDDGGAAFPTIDACFIEDAEGRFEKALRNRGGGGMTLRDYFAAKVLQSLVEASCFTQVSKLMPDGTISPILHGRSGFPTLAYEYADAMLAARAA